MAHDLTLPQLRYTAAQFTATNPVPAAGVLCVETDTDVTKTGDGSTAYLSLPRTQLSSDERRSADDLYAVRNGASTSVKVDGVAQSGIAAFTATLDETGETTFNLTALIPGVTSAYMISAATTGSTAVTASVNGSTLSAFTVAFGTVPDLDPPNGETIICTFAYNL